MDPDLMLVLGIVFLVLSIPSLISAFSEGRPPRTSAILAVTAAVLIVVAVQNYPGTYRISEIPDVFFRVIGRYLN